MPVSVLTTTTWVLCWSASGRMFCFRTISLWIHCMFCFRIAAVFGMESKYVSDNATIFIGRKFTTFGYKCNQHHTLVQWRLQINEISNTCQPAYPWYTSSHSNSSWGLAITHLLIRWKPHHTLTRNFGGQVRVWYTVMGSIFVLFKVCEQFACF